MKSMDHEEHEVHEENLLNGVFVLFVVQAVIP